MKSPQAYVLLLLVGTTVGGAILAWRQYGELVELRASAMNRDERAELQKRIWDLEKLNREMQDKLATTRAPGADSETVTSATDEERPGRERGGRGSPGGRGDTFQKQATAVRELMSKPEVQALLSQQQKAAIEARYAALFRNLNLPPEQAARLTALLAERGTTVQDVMSAAREQGIEPRENPAAFRKLVADAQNQINDSIKATIGDQGFAQLTNYEQTMPQRSLVNDLQQRLSYSSTPLTATQAEQLVQILATNQPPRAAPTSGNRMTSATDGAVVFRGGPPPDGGSGFRGPDVGAVISAVGGPAAGMLMGAVDGVRIGGPQVTPNAVAQAQGVLSPPQVAALQQIQQQQQAQQQLREMVSETMKSTQPPPPAAGTASPPRKRGGE